jgi:phospholipid/cholesterol/gamma-HCH transport system substrate-binding protein
MPLRVTWRSLIPGVIALGVVLAFALGVLLFAGIGRIRGEKLRLHVVTNQARGVLRGTEVWLAGQKVGLVDEVTFRPPSTDTSTRVVISIIVKASDADQIRRDSHAEVRSGANIVGPVVVYITPGTPAVSRVANGDTLRAGPQSDFESAATKMKAALQEVGPLMADARTVMQRVRDPRGTVGAVITGGITGRGDVAELRARVSQLRASWLGPGDATESRANVFAQAHLALARVDSVRTLIASTRTSFGRFRRDSTLMVAVASIGDELGALRASLDSAGGSISRLQRDSALTQSVANAQREMATLFADIKRRPLHYIQF